MEFDAVLFDIGGVLEVVESMDFSSKYEDLLGLPAGTIAGHTADLWPAGALGLRTEDEIRREMSSRVNLSAAVVEEIFEDMWAQYLGTADIELTNYLAGLRPRLRTGLLSNSFVGAREREETAYGFSGLVDDIVYSHEVGIAKPDQEIYALACRRLDVDPTRTVFVDDAQIAVDGAAAVGMTTILHDDTHSTIAQLDTLLT